MLCCTKQELQQPWLLPLCQWRDLGFIPLRMGLLHPSSSLHLNPFKVASMP